MILVDSNVLLDIFGEDEAWRDWSIDAMERAAVRGAVAINAIVIAEVAPRYGRLADFLDRMAMVGVAIEPIGEEAAYRAGTAFQAYRQRRGVAKSILADFMIGGHASSSGATILTRDPRFYRAYFADVPLITPERDRHD